MKKNLLLGASLLAVLSVNAAEPGTYKEAQLYCVSNNGQYLAGYYNSSTTFVNRATGEVVLLEGDDIFVPGNISPISDLGVMVGSSSYYDGHAACMKDGVVTILDSPNPDMTSHANSITADGTIIVGSVGTSVMSMEDTDVPMQLPTVWELQEDGSYGNAVVLPYPDKDFTGRVPQYVTALVVNSNGNIIMGQVVDYSGMMIQNIKYTRDDNGKWSYTLLDTALINPNNYTFPEYPGDSPERPAEQSYMTDEEVDACEAAQEEYFNNGDWNATYPEYTDYMTAEEKAAYEADMAVWTKEYSAWETKYDAFMTIFYKILNDAPAYKFNNMSMSGNGKYMVTTSTVTVMDENGGDMLDGGFGGYTEYNAPVLFDVETGDIKIYPYEPNVHVTTVLDDGTLLGSVSDAIYSTYIEAYAWKLGEETPTNYFDYLSSINPESAAWVKENCTHPVMNYVQDADGNWQADSYEDTMVFGLVKGAPDKSTFVNYCAVLWDDEDGAYVISYAYDGIAETGVKTVAAAAFTVKALKGGRVFVDGDVKNLTVSDMNGRVVYTGKTPNGILNLRLSNGAYIIKATATDGNTKVVKAVF
jgi:hypothetical protein